MEISRSLKLATGLLGKQVTVAIDRPRGSKHPKWGFIYEVNYGYIPGTIAPDGKELDAYVLLVDKPLTEFQGIAVAIIHRLNDDDDKLIVIPTGTNISDTEIEKQMEFMEKWFTHEIIQV